MNKRKFQRRKRVNLKTSEGKTIQVFETHLKGFTKHIVAGNFSEISIKVEDEGVVCAYITPSGSGQLVLQNIADK